LPGPGPLDRLKLLIALLQTPIHEIQWLIAKLISGMVLTITDRFDAHFLLMSFFKSP
jgi:hypothetical protein